MKYWVSGIGVCAVLALVFFSWPRFFESKVIKTPAPSAILAQAAKGETTLLFTGDIMLSRSVGALMASKQDYNRPFEKIEDFTRSADLTVANLETPVSTRGVKVGSIYSFRSDPKVLQGLQFAGFDLVTVANNHAWDYGRTAFTDTLNNLASAGISYIGGGHAAAEAHAGVVKDVNGTRIGFLAYTDLLPASLAAGADSPGLAIYNEVQMQKDIAAIKTRSDIVAVSFHFGDEYKSRHNPTQEMLAHAAIDYGADLVIGHHPHVVEDVEQYRGKWIAYSLGNFVFDQNFSTETQHGLMIRAFIKGKTIDRIEKVPVAISDEYQPVLE